MGAPSPSCCQPKATEAWPSVESSVRVVDVPRILQTTLPQDLTTLTRRAGCHVLPDNLTKVADTELTLAMTDNGAVRAASG